MNMIDTKDKIGVVLPGGGILAVESQAGMLQAMIDSGIKFDFIYACSGGGLSGIMLNSGTNFIELFKKLNMNRVLVRNKGIISYLFGKPIYQIEGVDQMINDVMGDSVYKNMVVNMTDVKTRETYYAYASRSTVIASMSIPKVFPIKKLTGTVFKDTTPYFYDGPMINVKEQYFLNDTEVYDGGIYNLYPFPSIEDILKCKKLYCLCCPHTVSPEDMNNGDSLYQAIYWIYDTMERGFRQCLSAYGGLPNVRIYRPEPQKNGSLLGFSKDFEIYYKSYEFMKKIIDGGKL
jgi:hypothetical protein